MRERSGFVVAQHAVPLQGKLASSYSVVLIDVSGDTAFIGPKNKKASEESGGMLKAVG
jgi:hypothetical protein